MSFRKCLFVALLAMMVVSPFLWGGETSNRPVGFSIKANAINTAFTLGYYLHEQQHTKKWRERDHHAFCEWEMAFRYPVAEDWLIGVFERGELAIQTNQDTLDLFDRDMDLVNDRRYDIDIAIEAYRSQGVELQYDWRRGLLSLSPSIRVFNANDLQDGTASGTGIALSDKTYELEGLVDYHYKRNLLYDSTNQHAVDGFGVGFDLKMGYELNPDMGVELTVRDLFTQIDWRSAPYTEATISTNNSEQDEDGYTRFRPIISGWEKSERFTQTITPKYKLKMHYTKHSIRYQLSCFVRQQFVLPWLDVHKDFAWGQLGLGFNPTLSLYRLSIRKGSFYFRSMLNDPRWDRMRALGLEMGFGLTF